MTKQDLINKRNKLFNEDFSIKENNVEEIKEFCNELTKITGIQACNSLGYVNEYISKLYSSALTSE